MAEAMDGASIEKRKEIMEKLKSSLPDDLTKTQRKKQAKIMYKKLQMKEKSKLQKKKPKHTKRLTKTMSSSDASKVRVAIELGYSELMTEKDIRMLIKQCQRCYSENRHSVKPLQLYMTSLSGTVKEAMETLEGYDKWDVHFHEKKYLDVFEQKDIVFLAAESPNILTELSDDKVYVIGGLVDHNRYKGYCYNEAITAGINHAQLPLKEHVTLNSRSVLTINHVFEILLKYEEYQDWQKAMLQVIPQRKIKSSEKHDNQDNEPQPTDDNNCEASGNDGDNDGTTNSDFDSGRSMNVES